MNSRAILRKSIAAFLFALIVLTAPRGLAPAKAEASAVYLAFTSDVHNQSGDVSSARLTSWVNTVTDKLNCSFDNFGICGDLGPGDLNSGTTNYWNNAQKVIDAVRNNKNIEKSGFFVCGNHEFKPGYYTHDKNTTTACYSEPGEYLRTDTYILYSFGSRQYNEIDSTEDIETMAAFLEENADFPGPIFILTHFPLHCYKGYTTGESSTIHDGKAVVGTSQVIDVLNEYPNAVLLWGHNHSNTNDHYDAVYTDAINTRQISFTYAAAGCMSDSEYGSSVNVKGKGLVAKIESGQLTLTYYTEGGELVGKSARIVMPEWEKTITFDNVETTANTEILVAIYNEKGQTICVCAAKAVGNTVSIQLPHRLYEKMDKAILFRLNIQSWQPEGEKTVQLRPTA